MYKETYIQKQAFFKTFPLNFRGKVGENMSFEGSIDSIIILVCELLFDAHFAQRRLYTT